MENIKRLSPIRIDLCEFSTTYYTLKFEYYVSYENLYNFGKAFFTQQYTDEKYISNRISFNNNYSVETQILTLNEYSLDNDNFKIIDYTLVFKNYIDTFIRWYNKAKKENLELNKKIGTLPVKIIYDNEYKKFVEIKLKFETENGKYFLVFEYPKVEFIKYDPILEMYMPFYTLDSQSIRFGYKSVNELHNSLSDDIKNQSINKAIEKKKNEAEIMEEFN